MHSAAQTGEVTLTPGSEGDVTLTPPGSAVLEVRELTIALPAGGERATAVSKVSFSVHRGEILCLVGESGSGKSVIAQGIMGLLPPALPVTGGAALLEGEDTTRASPERLRQLRAARMSMIFQEPMTALNPVMRCGEQLDEVLVHHTSLSEPERRAKIIATLQEVLLPDPARMFAAYPHQLSGGQRQRIMIAMALVLDPALLIADEPTTALDVTTQAQILKLIADLQARHGTGVLFITHDFGVVAKMCDRVAVMYAGKVVETAPTWTLFERPVHPYTEALLASVPDVRFATTRLASIKGSPPSIYDEHRGCPFVSRCRHAMARCDEAYPPETEVEPGHRTSCWKYA